MLLYSNDSQLLAQVIAKIETLALTWPQRGGIVAANMRSYPLTNRFHSTTDTKINPKESECRRVDS